MADPAPAGVSQGQASVEEVYVGPRPFERSERGLFFGRDREISELLSLVVASRVVLCYAPSGAGKTSLVNAGLLPRLEEEGFEVLPSIRVRGLIPEGIERTSIPNIYVFNAILSLAGDETAPGELAGRTLAEYLSTRPHMDDEEGFPAPRILVFDQFEELLTSYPERWQEREAFFQQVREALQADPLLRVIFIMREDFVARVEPYMRQLKPYQQARFRLPLLGLEGARAAITGPLRGTGRHFKEGVVAALIEELLKVRVETAQGEAIEVVGENVEPVQLQVVCQNLWNNLPPDVQEISLEHLEAYGDVDQALKSFYESCLAEARTKLGADELALREWFEHQLITPAGTRGIVFRDAKQTAGLLNPVVDFLENRHLIRGEWRAGSRWYELTHDRFIEPIQRANLDWRERRRARRNRWVRTGAFVALASILCFALFSFFIFRPLSPPQAVSAATVTAAQINVSAAEGTAVVAQENAANSQSRQLAAQALLHQDQQVALLLAIEANRRADTKEARWSLHKLFSSLNYVDGKFLRELDPDIVSPKLVKRLEDHRNWVVSVAFSPDGQHFVSGSADATLIVWDVATGGPAFPPMSGPTSEVLSVAYSPDGSLIASGYFNGEILLWDAFGGGRLDIQLPQTHRGPVLSVAFSPDGLRLASGGEDGTIRIWELSSGSLLATLGDGKAAIGSVSWSPDGQYLASGGADAMVRLWNSESYDEVHSFSGHHGEVRGLAWSYDGQNLGLASCSVIEAVRQSRGEVILWNVETGEEIARPLGENVQPVRSVAFDPSSSTLAIGQGDGTIVFWDVRKGQTMGDPLKVHNKQIGGIAFSPDGHFMVSGSFDETVILWDLSARTRSIAFHPNGSTLAASQGTEISLWDTTSDQTGPLAILSGHTEDVLALAFSPDGYRLASAGLDDSLQLWNITNGQVGPPLSGFGGAFETFRLGFSPDGKRLVSTSTNGSVLLWDLEAFTQHGPEPIYYKEGVIESSLDPRGEVLYLGGRDGTIVNLEVASGASEEQVLPDMQGRTISSLAFSPDGGEVAFLRDSGIPIVDDGERAHGITISQWDQSFDPTVNPKDIDFVLIRATQGNTITDSKFEEFYEAARAIPIRGAYHVFQPDQPWREQADHFLSVVKDKDFQFFTLDLELTPADTSKTFVSDAEQWLKYVDEQVEQRILLHTFPSFYQTWVSPAGSSMKNWPLLIMSYSNEPNRNGSPVLPTGVSDWKIWQYSDGRGLGAQYGVDAGEVILNVYNGTLTDMWNWLEPTFTIVYDRDSGRHHDPAGPTQLASPNGIAFSPDGAYVAIAGKDNVSLWEAKTGNEITTLPTYWWIPSSVTFSPDGSKLAIGTENGTVILWDLSLLGSAATLDATTETACFVSYRNLTEQEWTQFFGDSPYRKICPELP